MIIRQTVISKKINKHMKYLLGAVFLIATFSLLNCSIKEHPQIVIVLDSVVTVENDEFVLGINAVGGAFVDFHLKQEPLNPFGWTLLESQMPDNNRPYTFDGHFLCTGRWGSPSPGEIKAGIPHNGEVNTQQWDIVSSPSAPGFKIMNMTCTAPIEKLDVERKVMIPESGNYFIVKEKFTNNLPIGRLSNVVQHGTIAAPFLTESTIINTNATLGFDQRTNYKYLEDSSFTWPNGKMADGTEIDLSRVVSEKGFVTSHIFEDSTGWITALNPEENILMGYIWKTREYPWLNVWHMSKDGKPFVQGLEFGTTGLGQPYELLAEQNVTFYGRKSFEYIDAGETQEKSWICFMVMVPNALEEVSSIDLLEDKLMIAYDGGQIELQGNFGF